MSMHPYTMWFFEDESNYSRDIYIYIYRHTHIYLGELRFIILERFQK